MIRLSRREKFTVGMGGAVVAVLLFLQLLVLPLHDERKALRQAVLRAQTRMAEMERLRSEYQTIKRQNAVFESRIREKPEGFSLFSYLDQLAGQAAIKDRITYMKPSTETSRENAVTISRVEMKIESARWQQLIDFFHRVETVNDLVDIKRLSITRGKGTGGRVDAIVAIETFDLM